MFRKCCTRKYALFLGLIIVPSAFDNYSKTRSHFISSCIYYCLYSKSFSATLIGLSIEFRSQQPILLEHLSSFGHLVVSVPTPKDNSLLFFSYLLQTNFLVLYLLLSGIVMAVFLSRWASYLSTFIPKILKKIISTSIGYNKITDIN